MSPLHQKRKRSASPQPPSKKQRVMDQDIDPQLFTALPGQLVNSKPALDNTTKEVNIRELYKELFQSKDPLDIEYAEYLLSQPKQDIAPHPTVVTIPSFNVGATEPTLWLTPRKVDISAIFRFLTPTKSDEPHLIANSTAASSMELGEIPLLSSPIRAGIGQVLRSVQPETTQEIASLPTAAPALRLEMQPVDMSLHLLSTQLDTDGLPWSDQLTHENKQHPTMTPTTASSMHIEHRQSYLSPNQALNMQPERMPGRLSLIQTEANGFYQFARPSLDITSHPDVTPSAKPDTKVLEAPQQLPISPVQVDADKVYEFLKPNTPYYMPEPSPPPQNNEPKVKGKGKAKAKVIPKPKTDTHPKSKSAPKTKAAPKPRSALKAKTDPNLKVGTNPKSSPNAIIAPKPKPNPKPKVNTTSGLSPNPKAAKAAPKTKSAPKPLPIPKPFVPTELADLAFRSPIGSTAPLYWRNWRYGKDQRGERGVGGSY
ncbi:hypothetical protein B0J11DRAFT_599481 [Dendryphion nanum]|uniref:Uncharacterized protein n=1 Tax=Dendryphion nanum TaxID=256645 RepID=A0A9P9D0N3_9PLEO|nr:hypothetical protein B0J11DRAFT_599481 [Dendryphion nanum]